MQLTRTLLPLAAFSALALPAQPARADFIIQAMDSTAAPGGTGAFDVNLVDTDPAGTAAYQVGGFSFELSVPSTSGVTFTDAEFNTAAPYIFAGNSLDEQSGSPLSIDSTGNPPFPTQDFTASDDASSGATAVGPGDTFGLGHISYKVAPGTPFGPVAVHFEDLGGATSFSDPNGVGITFTTQDGTINVAPEPSQAGMLALMALGLGGLLLKARRRS